MSDDRHSKLLLLLLSRGETSVHDIAASLGASSATVRRDLLELEQTGQVERTHGAARVATGSRKELAFSAREQSNIEAKRAIAHYAVELIEPSESIFLDAGTTVLQLARYIRSLGKAANVFTNGLVIAQELAHVESLSVTLIGGRVRPENLSMVGPAAIGMLNGLWFDRLFLGASAIDASGVITSIDAEEAAINAQMIARSACLVVLADASKFDRRSTYAVSTLKQGDVLISDGKPKGALADQLRRSGVDQIHVKSTKNG